MNTETSIKNRCFRFRVRRDKWLTAQIAEIETLATERLRAGIPYQSVHTGALALLQMAMDGAVGELAEPPA